MSTEDSDFQGMDARQRPRGTAVLPMASACAPHKQRPIRSISQGPPPIQATDMVATAFSNEDGPRTASSGSTSAKSRVQRLMRNARQVRLLRRKQKSQEDDLPLRSQHGGDGEGLGEPCSEGTSSNRDKVHKSPGARTAEACSTASNTTTWKLPRLMAASPKKRHHIVMSPTFTGAASVEPCLNSVDKEVKGVRSCRARGYKGEEEIGSGDVRFDKSRILDAVWCDGPSVKDLRAGRRGRTEEGQGEKGYGRSKSVAVVGSKRNQGVGMVREERRGKSIDGGPDGTDVECLDEMVETNMLEMMRRKMAADGESNASANTDGTETQSSMYSVQGFFDCLIDIENATGD